MEEHGYYYYDRMDLPMDQAQEVVKKLSSNPPEELAKMKVIKVETLDGLKLSFKDESWILFRASGTEPLLRIYVEGRSEEEVKLLLLAGQELVKS
jgi:phosphomannomutase